MLAMMSAVQSGKIPTSALAKAIDPAEIAVSHAGVYGPPPISDEEKHIRELEAQLEILLGLGACATSIAAVVIAANVPKRLQKDDKDGSNDKDTSEETAVDMQQPEEESETDIDSLAEDTSPR